MQKPRMGVGQGTHHSYSAQMCSVASHGVWSLRESKKMYTKEFAPLTHSPLPSNAFLLPAACLLIHFPLNTSVINVILYRSPCPNSLGRRCEKVWQAPCEWFWRGCYFLPRLFPMLSASSVRYPSPIVFWVPLPSAVRCVPDPRRPSLCNHTRTQLLGLHWYKIHHARPWLAGNEPPCPSF